MRICFLFNHDQIHQVAHSLPVAIALAKSGFAGEIIVATTTERMANEVQRMAGDMLNDRIEHVRLGLKPFTRQLSGMLGRFVPAAKILVYRDNLEFFRSLDVLVVAEKTSLLLKSQYGLNHLLMIHTRHGAGDRAIGFDKASSRFDHVLCSGPKIKQRLIRETGLPADKISMVGYPKFDLLAAAHRTALLQNGRPTVLYNPHPSPHLSSWYRHGREMLDFFVDNPDYNLIFAPHVMLFERNFVLTIDKLTVNRAGELERRYLRGDNIHIDLGSRASTDMTYTLGADIYIGEASSQVYEFMLKPRPCIFINSNGHDWRGDPNFRHWEAGEVISRPDELGPALARAQALHTLQYRAVQERLFAESFDLSNEPSSDRAARVIADIANPNAKRYPTTQVALVA
ncbi:hypothetical protein MB02_12420 [Croceicoccus estronivorus]|uniref:hypothetical protein n=1 Tax=Croceicoccus estronivorus TaxID=1172626 RepID=UPI000837404C|nr:hypothetical protein [Croceicoccus estronivorus]OCC23413.1 hypothetical protein MB02_12420 [Croceicoccus estronivorus]